MSQQHAQLAATIILNEIAPRAKNLGVKLDKICTPQNLYCLITAELHGVHNRADTRRYLDNQGEVKWQQHMNKS